MSTDQRCSSAGCESGQPPRTGPRHHPQCRCTPCAGSSHAAAACNRKARTGQKAALRWRRFAIGRSRCQLTATGSALTAGDGKNTHIAPHPAQGFMAALSRPLTWLCSHLGLRPDCIHVCCSQRMVTIMLIEPARSPHMPSKLAVLCVRAPGAPGVRREPHDGQRAAARSRGPARRVVLQVPSGSVHILGSGVWHSVVCARGFWSSI